MKSLGKKEHEIRQSCMACGFSCVLDQKHRLATFIIKNPPPEDEKTEKAMKAQAQKGKAAAAEEEAGDEVGMGGLGDESNGLDHSAEGNGVAGDNGNGVPEGEDWVDGSDQVDGAPAEEMTEAMKALVVDPDADLPLADRLDKFLAFIQEKLAKADKGPGSIDSKPIVTEMNRLDLDQEKATLILARALFTPENATTIPKDARSLFLRFTHQDPKSQQ